MQFCKNCGSPFEGQFCGKCGTPAGQAPGYAAAPPPPPPVTPSYAAAPPPPSYPAPPPVYPHPAPAPPSYAPPSPQSKGFFGSLFDLSFTSFVAPKIIKFLFVLFLIVGILGTLGGIAVALARGGTYGIFSLVVAPIFLFLGILYIRVALEVMMVLFRIVEHTEEIARNTRR